MWLHIEATYGHIYVTHKLHTSHAQPAVQACADHICTISVYTKGWAAEGRPFFIYVAYMACTCLHRRLHVACVRVTCSHMLPRYETIYIYRFGYKILRTVRNIYIHIYIYIYIYIYLYIYNVYIYIYCK